MGDLKERSRSRVTRLRAYAGSRGVSSPRIGVARLALVPASLTHLEVGLAKEC